MWRINSITVWFKATLPRSLSQTAITTTWHPQIWRCFVAATLNKAHGWTSYQTMFCYKSWGCSPHFSRWNMGLWTLKAFLFKQQKWFCLMYVLSRPISLRVWKQVQERKVSIFQVDDLVGHTCDLWPAHSDIQMGQDRTLWKSWEKSFALQITPLSLLFTFQ